MLSKKRSGFVLLLIVSVLLLNVFVSAYTVSHNGKLYSCPTRLYSSTRCTLLSTGSTSTTPPVVNSPVSYYPFNLVTSPRSVFGVSMNFPIEPAMIGKSLSFNIGASSGSSCTVYIDYRYADGTSLEPAVILTNVTSSGKSNVSSNFNASALVNRIGIRTTDSCNGKIVVNSLSLQGRYYNASASVPLNISSIGYLESENYAAIISVPKSLVVQSINANLSSSTSASCKLYAKLLDNSSAVISAPALINKSISMGFNSFSNSSQINLQTAPETKFVKVYLTGNGCSGNINLTSLVLNGFYPDGNSYASVCSSFIYSDWSACVNGQKNRTLLSQSPAGCSGGNPELVTSCAATNCSRQCGNVTSALSTPRIASFPSNCTFGVPCTRTINFESSISNVAYDLVWTYNYYSGDSVQICACNGTTEVLGHTVKSSGSPVSLRVSDDNTKIISSVELKVYAFNGTSRSEPASYVLNTVDYGCSNGCFKLGNTNSIVDSDPTNYLLCSRVGNSYCFNWTVKSCSENTNKMLFDSDTGKCKNNGTYSCTDEDNGPQVSFCNFSTISLSKATAKDPLLGVCGLDGFNVGCYQCASGYKYDSSKGYCTKCVGNQQMVGCEQNGGICNNSNTFNGVEKNESFDCCNPAFNCFKCPEGQHFYNNTCVSNNCTGINRPLFNDSNVVFGINVTTNSSFSMIWNFINSSYIGPCQWTCAMGYKLNESDNVSCVEKEKFNCTLEGGICSSAVSLTNATYNSAGNCSSASAKCFVCQNNLKSNGTACVPKTCEDDGKISNGIGCVSPLTTCETGCVYDKNGKSICLPDKARVNAPNGKQYYCNGTSHKFSITLLAGASCSWNAQCADNFCFVNETTQTSVCQSLDSLSGIRSLVVNFVCWFKHMGNADARQQCRLEEVSSFLGGD